MLKLLNKLIFIVVVSVGLISVSQANTEQKQFSSADKEVLKFGKRLVEKSLRRTHGKVTLKKMKIAYVKDLKDYKGWKGYILSLELNVPGQVIKDSLKLFSNGQIISVELFKLENGMELSKILFPPLDKSFYNPKYIISGNKNAKHKIVVFSDPECPFCKEYVPDLLGAVKKYPNDFVVYHYIYPLERIHPASKTLSLLTLLATKDGKKDVELKVYQKDFDDTVDYKNRKVNMKKLLLKFNKLFGTNYTKKDLENKQLLRELKDQIQMAEKVFVRGTPAVFFDGEYDYTRYKYEKFIKNDKKK